MPGRELINYFPLNDKGKTIVTLLERRKTQLTIQFKRWRSKYQFEAFDENTGLYLFEPAKEWSLPVKDAKFTQIMSENSVLFAALDAKMREIGQLNALGVDFVKYSINVLENIITIDTEATSGVYSPMITLPPYEFISIMQNPSNFQLIQDVRAFCNEYGASVDDDLRAYLSSEE